MTQEESGDEIEAFISQRERVLLGSESSGSESYEADEAILDLPASDDSADEQWGKTRRTFYSADTAADDLEDEAREARKVQKRTLAGMRTEAPADYRPGVVRLDLELSDDEDRFATAADVRGMSVSEIASMVTAEVAESAKHSEDAQAALRDFHASLAAATSASAALSSAVKGVDADGLSFLQTKTELLVGYCANLALCLLLRAKGRFREDHPVVERLVRYRLLLEKVRPLEARLQHTVDRLIHAADDTGSSSSAALAHRPNPAALVSKDAESGESDSEYRAPKVAPMRFDKQRGTDVAAAVASRARVAADMRAEVEDAPAEEAADPVRGTGASSLLRSARAREAFEEDNMLRVSLSSKERKRLAALETRPADDFAELNDFLRQSSAKRSATVDRLMGTRTAASREAKPAQKDDDSELSDIEDDMAARTYKQAAGRAKERKAAKGSSSGNAVQRRPAFDADAGDRTQGHRTAPRAIMRNRGMTPKRPSSQDNPRVAQRQKYEKAQRKLRSFKTMPASRDRPYAGESSGIRTNVSRSVRF